MPSTFSHPVAALPLKRFFPRHLSFAALVSGTMTPDFGYYIHAQSFARQAHTLSGSFVICIPTGILLLALFYALRRPLCFALPWPHREALMPLTETPIRFHARGILIVLISILIGAWTHIVWDAFTHDGSPAVERIEFLRWTLFEFGGARIAVYYVLQQASTVAGGLILAVTYFRWLRRKRNQLERRKNENDKWRYTLILVTAIVSIAMAIPAAINVASGFSGYLMVRVLVFRSFVYSVAYFAPLLTVSALLIYFRRKRLP